MICNPTLLGATSRRWGVASGVGPGADDVQGLPFFLIWHVRVERVRFGEKHLSQVKSG